MGGDERQYRAPCRSARVPRAARALRARHHILEAALVVSLLVGATAQSDAGASSESQTTYALQYCMEARGRRRLERRIVLPRVCVVSSRVTHAFAFRARRLEARTHSRPHARTRLRT